MSDPSPISPALFADQMKQVIKQCAVEPKKSERLCVALMADTLRSLGYGEGVDRWRKWYG